jgi:hypothetical protein
MRLLSSLMAGLVLAGILALEPDTSFAHGGGGGGAHFGGFHGGSGSRGVGDRGGMFHGHFGQRAHGFYQGHPRFYYGNYGVPDYGLDDSIDDADPDLDDNGPSEDPATPSAVLPDEANSLVSSVQRELTTLGYYQGPIDGVSGPQTEDALRWFQAVNHLPVTGRIDGATVQALHLA